MHIVHESHQVAVIKITEEKNNVKNGISLIKHDVSENYYLQFFFLSIREPLAKKF